MDKKNILEIVRQEIKKWDSVKILNMGAPENEYDMEIIMITNRIKNTSGVKEIANIVYEVLIEMFDKETFNNIDKLKEECHNVAKRIYTNINHK